MSRLDFIYIDLEATGLDHDTLRIVEVAAVGVTKEYDELFTVNEVVKLEPGTVWAPAAYKMAEANGLIKDLATATRSIRDVELMILSGLDEFDATEVILGGSGVSHFDHRAIENHMPELHSRLRYFTDDIGQDRRSYARAVGKDLVDANDRKTHRAYDDVQCHLAEARAFRAFYQRAARLIAEDDERRAA